MEQNLNKSSCTTTPHIFIIAPPGRKRENLAVMIYSRFEKALIDCFDSCQQMIEVLSFINPDRIIFFHSLQEEDIDCGLPIIHKAYPTAKLILLADHPHRKKTKYNKLFDETIYENQSLETIYQLVANWGYQPPI